MDFYLTSTYDTFVLSTSDFHEILGDFPKMRVKMERVAEERLFDGKMQRQRKGSVKSRMGNILNSADQPEL